MIYGLARVWVLLSMHQALLLLILALVELGPVHACHLALIVSEVRIRLQLWDRNLMDLTQDVFLLTFLGPAYCLLALQVAGQRSFLADAWLVGTARARSSRLWLLMLGRHLSHLQTWQCHLVRMIDDHRRRRCRFLGCLCLSTTNCI